MTVFQAGDCTSVKLKKAKVWLDAHFHSVATVSRMCVGAIAWGDLHGKVQYVVHDKRPSVFTDNRRRFSICPVDYLQGTSFGYGE
jgi:hypothetical protein